MQSTSRRVHATAKALIGKRVQAQKPARTTETGTETEKNIPCRHYNRIPTKHRGPDCQQSGPLAVRQRELLREVNEQIDELDRVTPLVVLGCLHPSALEQGASRHLVIAQSQQVAINNRPRPA